MIFHGLYIGKTETMGRGVFTPIDIGVNTVIEVSPVIVMTKEERKFLDQTLLHDYIFEWGMNKDLCCMALGYVPVYNHSYRSNCEYEMPARLSHSRPYRHGRAGGNPIAIGFENDTIKIKTIRSIKAGEELFINYNGDWNDEKSVWFDRRSP